MDANNAVSLIAPLTSSFEGFSPTPYLDAGSYAIGYGNHYYQDGSPVQEGDPVISQPDAYALMAYWLQQTAAQVIPLLQVEVSDNMLGALTDLAYNWGIGNFANSKILGLINQGADQATITAQWNATATTSQGVTVQDLIKRRAQESNFAFQSGSSLSTSLVLVGALVIVGLLIAKKFL